MKYSRIIFLILAFITLLHMVTATDYNYWKLKNLSNPNMVYWSADTGSVKTFNGVKTFYIYNNTGTYVQKLRSVFDCGDNFSGTSYNSSLWNFSTTGTGSLSVVSNELKFSGGTSSHSYIQMKCKPSYDDVTVITKLKITSASFYNIGLGLVQSQAERLQYTTNQTVYDFFQYTTYYPSLYRYNKVNASKTKPYVTGAYVSLLLKWNRTQSQIWLDTATAKTNYKLNRTISSINPYGIKNLYFASHTQSAFSTDQSLYYKYILMNRWLVQEPTYKLTYLGSGVYKVVVNNTANLNLSGYAMNITLPSNFTKGNLRVTDIDPTSINYTITAKSSFDNSAINSFTVKLVNGTTTKIYYTSTGTVAKILGSDTRKYNITFYNVTNYHDKVYLNYQFSVSGNIEGLMNKKGAYINFFTKDNTMTEKARITSSGFLGVGTSAPQYMIHVNSTTDGNILALQDTDGLCLHNPESASETVTCSSDKILKKDIHDTDVKGVETISKYRIKDFTLVASGQVRTGVIAQELKETMPDKVKNIDGILMVELPNLWTLAKAIQELSDGQNNLNYQISSLQNTNQILTTQLTDANNKIITMQTDIETMKLQICTINRNCPKIQTQSLAMTTNTTNSTELI